MTRSLCRIVCCNKHIFYNNNNYYYYILFYNYFNFVMFDKNYYHVISDLMKLLFLHNAVIIYDYNFQIMFQSRN